MGDAAENLEPINDELLDAFKPHEMFCKAMLDAYAVIDRNGRVVKANPLLSQLVGLKSRQILKAGSLDELLEFQINGKPLKVSDILANTAPTRIDEVGGRSAVHSELNLIIGVYPFLAASGEILGSFLLIRDVTAETNLQGKYKDKADKSIRDALTGLFNRAYFTEYLDNTLKTMELAPSDSSQRHMCIIMLDIDFFKKVNDVYGHAAGDYVIKGVADVMKQNFRKTDIICRYGGEEFLAILPGTELQGSMVAAEKIRKSIEAKEFVFEGTRIPVTISSGIAQVNVGHESGHETMARADAALYHSKQNGRNRVSIHDGKTPR